MITQTLTARLRRGAFDPGTTWRLVAFGLGGLAVLGYLLPRPWPGAALFLPAQLVALVAVIAGVRQASPSRAGAWKALAVGLTLSDAGLISVGLGVAVPDDLAFSAMTIVGYAVLLAGILRLIGGDGQDGDAASLLESLIVATALAIVSWYLLVQPWLEGGGTEAWINAVLATAFPSLDLALVAIAVRTAWLQRGLSPWQGLLLCALAANTITDIGSFLGFTALGYQPGPLTNVGIAVVVPLVAAAALHPSAHQTVRFHRRLRDQRVLGLRLVGVAASLLIAPVILYVVAARELADGMTVLPPPGMPSIEMEIALTMIVLAGLVAARLFLALWSVERVLRARDELALELKHQALSDSLTLLPNRAAFAGRLHQALGREGSRSTAVLFCDLDDFKTFNDTLGHATGDQLLVAVAQRLQGSIRPWDLAARLGGDEFAVLLADVEDPEIADRVAQRILDAFAEPFTLDGSVFVVRISIGVAIALESTTPTDLMRDADIAMYLAKEGGKARAERFEPAMRARVAERMALQTDLVRALEQREFRLAYQPITSLDEQTVVGAEALLRWDHPVRGVVAPLDFVPQAERSGLIVPLGEWVLATACRQMRTWLDQGAAPGAHISVNVSPVQLVADGFVRMVRQTLDTTGLSASNLMLELTESALVNAEHAGPVLVELKRLGVKIAIDDFGTGYSAMSYLSAFPIDVLKIDRSFVTAMCQDEHGRLLVKTIMQLARSLDLETIAEGIEETDQLAALRGLGCRFGQGYLLGRPVDPQVVQAMLVASPEGGRTMSRGGVNTARDATSTAPTTA